MTNISVGEGEAGVWVEWMSQELFSLSTLVEIMAVYTNVIMSDAVLVQDKSVTYS